MSKMKELAATPANRRDNIGAVNRPKASAAIGIAVQRNFLPDVLKLASGAGKARVTV